MRCRRVPGTVGLGCFAGLMILVMVVPAAANPDRGGRMGPRGLAAECERAAMSTPPGRPGGLKLTTDIPDGASVEPGQVILVRLTWDPNAWSGPDLDMALACVEVKGGLDPDLSAGERPAANDGVFEYRLLVPDTIRPDCDICVQGYLAGMTDDCCREQVTSDRRCFITEPPPPPTPPVTTPVTVPPAPTTTTTTAPTEVGGITASQPSPAPLRPAEPAVASAAELPRTGSVVSRRATAGGGLGLTLGGLAMIGGAARRIRRRIGG
jgi:hypothetical protein